MRTRIFNSFADLPKEFIEDFNILWNLPENKRFSLIPHVINLRKTETTIDKKNLLDKIFTEIGENTPDILRVLKLLEFIYIQWDPTRDNPENFLRDINELELIPSNKADEGERFLLNFFNELKNDNKRRLQKIFSNSLLPSLESMITLIDFRAVIENPYRFGDKIEDFEPKCIDFVPVIIVRFQRDISEPTNFEFQCKPDDIRYIISHLQATLKELESGKKSFIERTSK